MRKCFFEADGETEFLNLAELKELSENGGYSIVESSDVHHYVHPSKKSDVILGNNGNSSSRKRTKNINITYFL